MTFKDKETARRLLPAPDPGDQGLEPGGQGTPEFPDLEERIDAMRSRR
jgi:hypothetical protein